MSRDIRSFFSSASKKTVEKKEDVDNVVSKKRKKQCFIESDSDDDVVFMDKKRGKPTETAKRPSQKKLEEVEDVTSIFGSKPAKRSSATTSNNKEPSPKKTKTKDSDTKGVHLNGKQECLVHSDDEFVATLVELENKKSSSKQSKKIEPKAEEKSLPRKEKKTEAKVAEKNPLRKETKSELKEETTLLRKEKNSEKKEDTKPLHTEKKASDSKISSKKSPEPKLKNSASKGKTPDRKLNVSLDEEDAALEEVWEKKKQQTDNYRKFLQRKGPAHLGEKEIPTGEENCLVGLTFVITGVLDSLDREGAAELIQNYGGKVTGGVSKNTSYVVTGEDAGPSKLEKAKSLKIPTIDEDGLLEMIKTRPSAAAPEAKPSKPTTPRASKHAIKTEPQPVVKKMTTPPKIKTESPTSKKPVSGSQSSHISSPGVGSQSTLPPSPVLSAGSNAMWVDKYKPQTVKHVIGQQTDRSNAKKLMLWLQEWDKNHSNPKEKKPKPSPWAKNDNGSAFKAALLSGPPGIGKTTTVQLVCKELEYDIVEFNASDTRSKKLLHEEVSEMLSTQSLSGMFAGSGKAALSKKRVLLMEEVDGMAGNNDRGGIAELILLIKKAKIPVICTCNDRGSQKIRSLVNYCFDLRFQKPKLEQIRAAMLSICFKEKVSIPKDAIDAMIVGTNFDIRQIIHMMSIWAAGQTKVDTGLVEKESKKSKKEFKLGIWEITPKVFSAEIKSKNAIYDKTNLFFQDYSLTPLFVQENYLSAVHGIAGNNSLKKKLEMMSKAADSIAKGDLVDNVIRGNQAWGLLPIQAIFSTVAPGIHLRGRLCGQAMFPSWLGKNSKKNKFDRLASELQMHMRLSITGSKQAVVLDYLNPMRDLVMTPLLSKGADGVSEAIDAMVEYNLIRDDLDKLSELSTWGSATSAWQRVDGKVKAQLTRQYNKMPIMTPFAIQSISGGAKRGQVSTVEDYEDGDEDETFVESDAEEEDADKDSMIKAKKVTVPKVSKSESSKGKGKAPAAKKGKK